MNKERKEYRLTKKYGVQCVEIRFAGHEWSGWCFPVCSAETSYSIYVPELGVYRRNTSI